MIFPNIQTTSFTSFKSFVSGFLNASDKKEGRISTSFKDQIKIIFGYVSNHIQPFSCLLNGYPCTNAFPVSR